MIARVAIVLALGWSGNLNWRDIGTKLLGLLGTAAVTSCQAVPRQALAPGFEAYPLPYEDVAEVSILDGGWLFVDIKPPGAEPDNEEEYTRIREAFALVPTNGNTALVTHDGRTWLVPDTQVARVQKQLAPGRSVSRPVPPSTGALGTRQTVATFVGTARLRHVAEGTYELSALDTATGEELTARFRFAPGPTTVSDSSQTSSCVVSCDHGSCSITCVGRVALCDCQNGAPRCVCGRRLDIELTIATDP